MHRQGGERHITFIGALSQSFLDHCKACVREQLAMLAEALPEGYMLWPIQCAKCHVLKMLLCDERDLP
jgi:hypothetical protein